jgi:hypothetical protein
MLLMISSVFLSAAVLGNGPETRSLIAKALTEPAQITLDNVRLVDAICQITEQTGVRIVMSPDTMRYVPQGPETLIEKVNIAHLPLREGLERLFGPLGMRMELADDHVRIVPEDALLCLGRAPSWDELQTLAELSSLQPGTHLADLDKLQDRIQFQVPAPDAWGTLSQQIENVGAGLGDDVLTVATGQLGWTWCVSGGQIVVTTFERQLRQRIKQPLSIRMNNRPLSDVFQAIGAALNTPVRVEAGAIAALPVQKQRNYFLDATHVSAEQVLEGIAANTGLGYLLSPDGIFFYNPNTSPAVTAPAAPPPSPGLADPYVGKIVIDLGEGKTFEWMIRRSELPDDLKQVRDRDIQQFIDEFRQRQITTGQP